MSEVTIPGRISTIIPAYNAASYLDATILSALRQTYADHEVILVNDGSTDRTEEVALRHAGSIKYIAQPNKGLSAARNAGVAASTGEWIAFLDADDLWDPLKLEVQMRSGASLADIIHCRARTIDGQGTVLSSTMGRTPPPRLTFVDLVRYNCIKVLTVVMRKRCYDSVGGMDAGNRIGAEDWQCWLKLILKGFRFLYVDQALASYRIHAGQMSGNPIRMCQGQVYVLDRLTAEFATLLTKEEARAVHDQYEDVFFEAAYALFHRGLYSHSLQHCVKGLQANLLSGRCWGRLLLCLLPFRSRLVPVLQRRTGKEC